MDWERQPAYGKARTTDYSALVARYSSWVYKCAGMNASAVASVPLRLYAQGGRSDRYQPKALSRRQKDWLGGRGVKQIEDVVEITKHPLLDMLDSANPKMTGQYVQELTALQQELTGNAYWWLQRGNLGTPTEIWPLLSQYVRIVPSTDDFVSGYLYGKSSMDQVAFKPEEVIHFKMPSPSDLYYGMGPLQAAVSAVDRSNAMAEYEQALWDNNARLDFAIVVKGLINEQDRQKLREEWRQVYGGRKRAGLPGVLWGDMDLKTFQFSPRDVGQIAFAKLSREEIAAIFGVPPTKLEISQARAEAQEGNRAYMADTIKPRLVRMEATLNETLVPMFDERLFLAYDECVPESEAARLEEIKVHLSTGLTTINEERADEGLAPIDGGDELLVPANMVPVGMAGVSAGPPMPVRSLKHLGGCPCPDCAKALDPMNARERQIAAGIKRVMRKQRATVMERLRG